MLMNQLFVCVKVCGRLWNVVVTLVYNWTVCEVNVTIFGTLKKTTVFCCRVKCSLWDNVWIDYHHGVIRSCDSRSTSHKQIPLGCQSERINVFLEECSCVHPLLSFSLQLLVHFSGRHSEHVQSLPVDLFCHIAGFKIQLNLS